MVHNKHNWITPEYNSADYLHVLITLDELEKVLKLTKIGKTPGQGNINSELYKYAPEEFKQEVTTIFKQYIQRKSHSKWMEKCRFNPNI